MLLFALLSIALFIASVILPNHIIGAQIKYQYKASEPSNTSICCINDTYTCNSILEYINTTIRNMSSFNEINIVAYNRFSDYINTDLHCDMVLGINEIEYLIARKKNRISHIDYFNMFSIAQKIPHNDLLLKNYIIAIPYCYTTEPLKEFKYKNIILRVLDEKNLSEFLLVKNYRLIEIINSNSIVTNVVDYILKNNIRLYNKTHFCNSIYSDYNYNSDYILNKILSYYDVQRIIAFFGE